MVGTMAKNNNKPLDVSRLRVSIDPSELLFNTIDELSEHEQFIGQDRAIEAVCLGIGMNKDGFNIFALGPTGVGKRSIVKSLLKKEAGKKNTPKDICYVHNFSSPRHPKLLQLKAGVGCMLASDMDRLIDILRTSIPEIFDSKAYTARIKQIQEEVQKEQEDSFLNLEKEAKDEGVAVVRTNQGFMLAALKDGKVISEEEFLQLPEDEREEKEEKIQKLYTKLNTYLDGTSKRQKVLREQITDALKYFTMIQVGSAINEIKNKYKDHKEVVSYLSEVEKAILEKPTDFRKGKSDLAASLGSKEQDDNTFNRYRVNVVVDNKELEGAPIVYEDNPTFTNLIGRIDHISYLGTLTTDFTQIRAGALKKANGGYLLIDALKLLKHPFSWEALKRALRAKEIRVENPYEVMGYPSTVSLKPCPIPLDIKVILFGDRSLYYLLCAYDSDFLDLFKVAADFDEYLVKNQQNNKLFFHMVKKLIRKGELKPIDKSAAIRLFEFASRVVNDQKKISTHVQRISDLLREADYYAEKEQLATITIEHLEQAIKQQKKRAFRIKELMHEQIERGLVLVDTKGSRVGQINGLSYLNIGSVAFGKPMRITAKIAVDSEKKSVIDIERESKLGGPIHSKGVMILSGYIGSLFASNKPANFKASLVMEQSYGGVEGDSASLAETCALLSAISEVPLSQTIAVTGSINQNGDVQAIGGVNEKIEGFFDICKERGLTKDHGVIIPKSNIDNLMLNKEVVSAAKEGLFNIFAVETVDEAVEILTGKTAGQKIRGNSFTKGSIKEIARLRIERFVTKNR